MTIWLVHHALIDATHLTAMRSESVVELFGPLGLGVFIEELPVGDGVGLLRTFRFSFSANELLDKVHGVTLFVLFYY